MEHNIIFDLIKSDQKYVKQYQDDCVFNASIKLLMEGSFSFRLLLRWFQNYASSMENGKNSL